MDAEFIAGVVLFGPAALALPAIAVAWHRGQRSAAAERAAFNALHVPAVLASDASPPTEPGTLATVSELGSRRRLREIEAGSSPRSQ